jgi:hypothetical protein
MGRGNLHNKFQSKFKEDEGGFSQSSGATHVAYVPSSAQLHVLTNCER